MIDFIEYVVAELKSKRLSRADALELIRQFSRKSSGADRPAALHPLVQVNTSDLSRMGFSSVFTGEEAFLADHRIRIGNGAARKLLPGAAYLEMARAATEKALRAGEGAGTLRLTDVVWLHPLQVEEPTEVSITLYTEGDGGNGEGIGFEISSASRGEDGQAAEMIHCQGRAAFATMPASRLDLESLRGRMGRPRLDASRLYATYREVGAEFGTAHRSMVEIHPGDAEALVRLVLPDIAESLEAMPLHPSLLDGALQACIGLLPDPDAPGRPSLPFALESLEILGPCAPEMLAWIRFAPGKGPGDRLPKVDIDLCDIAGAVCVSLRGFASRAPGEAPAVEEVPPDTGVLLAIPVWKAAPAPASSPAPAFSRTHVLLHGFSDLDPRTLEEALPGSRCRAITRRPDANPAERFATAALEVFELLRETMGSTSQGPTLVQIAVAGTPEDALLAGLGALLKTAHLENPRVTGQVLLHSPGISAAGLAALLLEGRTRPQDALIKHEDGARYVSVLEDIPEPAELPRPAFKSGGIYLITGGLGGLGVVFAKAILETHQDAQIILSGRSPLDETLRGRLENLPARPGQVAYRQADIADPDQAKALVAGILTEWGRLDGVLHAAGIIRDNYILKKSAEEFRAVLAPKVAGTFNLDEATRDLDLDFLVLFSSGAAVMGNAGQSDYAAANAFMDMYAAHRDQLVAKGARRGKTLSVDWPLWQEGGMGMDEAGRARARETSGMLPMGTPTGLRGFHRCLELGHPRVLVVEGDLTRLRHMLFSGQAAASPRTAEPPTAGLEPGDLEAKTLGYLKGQLASLLKVPAHRLDPEAPLEKYGIDSILAMNLTGQLEKAFGPLSKTLFFEYQTLRELTAHFLQAHASRLAELLSAGVRPQASRPAAPAMPAVVPRSLPKPGLPPRRARSASASAAAAREPQASEPIAIIGLSGRYPEAPGLEDYWRNLRDGKDCIVEVPASRWDWREFYSSDRNRPGSHYSKWGGFIAGVDEFDPRFFHISPLEAELMDPQERLFLQHAWMAVEDAGYSRAALQIPYAGDQAGQVGVYAGVMYSEYQLFGISGGSRERRLGIPGSYASIANRVSYVLNLHGPSLTLDSMCSSSLTAIHLACQDLKLGRTSMAIAGGVNVSIHPNKYLVISAGQFISGDGHCQSFGEGGEGYIPGEGVGVVVLKRLSEAMRDGDHIHGVIKASAINHGGKTNGYSVPNPQSQAGVIARALSECGVDARRISYLEAHGTGTKLGDPIEIAALTQAFRRHTGDNGFCLIGSAKSNIGHCESAAGIAGLTKVLLQMRHGQIAPSLHSARLNPHIDFAKTPFEVNQVLRPWDRPVIGGREILRLAGISSFGAGGSNAHLIVEEFIPAPLPTTAVSRSVDGVAIVLSARTTEQLAEKTSDLLAFIRGRTVGSVGSTRGFGDLAALAYTLQTGREAMDERLGFVAVSFEELESRLEAFMRDGSGEGLFRGRAEGEAETLALFNADVDLRQTLEKWIAQGKLEKLLGLWVKGLKLDWNELYIGSKPRRVSLPTYPFARERYWVDTAAVGRKAGAAVLHPLLHVNVSDLTRQRYASVFIGDEPFLADHHARIDGLARKVLPAAACLEMARAAVENSLPPGSGILELRDMAWSRPVVAGEEETPVAVELFPERDGSLSISLLGRDSGEEAVHFEGRAARIPVEAPAPLDLAKLAGEMRKPALEAGSLYAAYARMGLDYGPSHRTVTEVLRGEGQVLARLRLPAAAGDLSGFILHPGLVDGALQSALGLLDSDHLPDLPAIPFALASIRVLAPCVPEMSAWVRRSAEALAGDTLASLDIDLCDPEGRILAQFRGLASRPLAPRPGSVAVGADEGTLMAVPLWEGAPMPLPPTGSSAFSHRVLLLGLPAAAERIAELIAPVPAVVALRMEGSDAAASYGEAARICLDSVRQAQANHKDGNALIQVVVADQGEPRLCAGLTGLLRTASLEDPRLQGQIILCEPDAPAEELARRLVRERLNPETSIIRYRQGERQVLVWRELPAAADEAPTPFRDDGVYLITGGLGGLGTLFAREILARARGVKVVLTGRSPLPEGGLAPLEGLASGTQRVSYLRLDLADAEAVKAAISSLATEYGRLDGVLHGAGMIADSLIPKKTEEELRRVLEPKVTGALNLDDACRDLRLDFLALFSSAAGALGNPGQADYAAANGFMDQFAVWRNNLAAGGRRHGHALSINWPLWRDGGMGLDAEGEELLYRTSGMRPMPAAEGLKAFRRALAARESQVLVLHGDRARLKVLLQSGRPTPVVRPTADFPGAPAGEAAGLVPAAMEYLRAEFAQVLKLRPGEIDPKAPLERYGIDSILAMRLTGRLEETFGTLPKTLFFEFQNVAGLAGFFAGKYPALIRDKTGLAGTAVIPRIPDSTGRAAPRQGARKARFLPVAVGERNDIAIVGLGGRYPQADTLERFWENLKAGKDCITEIPPDRWDGDRFFEPGKSSTGKSRSKWGAFLSDVDKFDPLFFNITPREAELMDPQERLFLETAWEAVEDAGYAKERLAAARVGVYVGVMYGQYELYGAEAMARGDAYVPGSSFASIANRVSYLFDFRGPSLAVDTMCSSSLTAIYLACEEIRKGGIDAALAGGVNLSLHPQKYLLLSQGNFTSSDGRCRSFGAGGDGYVPGEGVGAVFLKPLAKALEDGDQVHGVIKAVALNHGGKTNGYTVPNPNAQAEVIGEALRRSGIDPSTIGCLEAHGTGTSLGDPIEILGLMKAFEGREGRGPCAIGSVKSNIGHLESAAGIASLTKALLQLKHGMLAPSLHAEPANPNIDFASTCFRLQSRLEPWDAPAGQPRRIGISSFGAGGSNAHLILEECLETKTRGESLSGDLPEVFLLSAKGGEALRRYAARMVDFLEKSPDLSLSDIAYTSQVGRSPLKDRLAILASDRGELNNRLKRWLDSGAAAPESEGIYQGDPRKVRSDAGTLMEGEAGEVFLRTLAENREVEKLAKLWVDGSQVDWALLGRRTRPKRVSLPTYPFARERHWIRTSAPTPVPARPAVSLPTAAETPPAIPAAPLETGSPASAPAVGSVESPLRFAFRPVWKDSELGLSEVTPASGPVLHLGPEETVLRDSRAWAESESAGQAVIRVHWDSAYREISDDTIALDPGNEKHMLRLVAWLKAGDKLPRRIVHHAAETAGIDDGEDAGARLDRGLDRGVYALFHLCKALIKHRHHVPVRILSLCSGEAEGHLPLHAALGGFFKTLAQENPKYQGKSVSLEGPPVSPEARLAAIVRILRGEFGEPTWSRKEIRYRFDPATGEPMRGARELIPLPLEGSDAGAGVRQKGVYLVSGGLGGLGLVFSAWLAEHFQARLVLFGRSAPGAQEEDKLARLRALSPDVLYVQADVTRFEDVRAAVKTAKAAFGRIDGVIHAAGVNKDNFLLKKTREEMEGVIGPKVYGAINLDRATREEELDLFVLFSSVAGVFGNPGQCDYAYGNNFLDAFAESREKERRHGRRSGKSLSISWPYWEEGGMRLLPADLAQAKEQIGLCPLPTAEGIRFWNDLLRSEAFHGIALYGIGSRIASSLGLDIGRGVAGAERNPNPMTTSLAEDLPEMVGAYLRVLIGQEIKLDPERIDPRERFASFGIDSIVISRLNLALERDLGEIPKTLFYEHETVADLATYIAREFRDALTRLRGTASALAVPAKAGTATAVPRPVQPSSPAPTALPLSLTPSSEEEDTRIAIVGAHGHFPGSRDLEAFWENLKLGKDLIGPVPPDRWDSENLYDPDPEKAAEGRIYCKWGGFLEDVDKFDSRFFNIPAEEAGFIDPQERIFVESVWSALEDAGYTRAGLKRRHPKGKSADVGVFVGVTTNSYHLRGAEAWGRGNPVSPGSLPWSIANRVSYLFDFQGPSLPVDTACSSSLVAMHLACESLKRRECQVAVAGGVNLYLHPSKYLSFCQKRSLAPDGKCRSFGAGEEGFVPGEGVGTLILKRLDRAVADGDRVLAVIAGSAYDHSGRSNGYSAPNPNSQAALIDQALRKARVHPDSIGYVEGHGTATRMGDSLEVTALNQAFRGQTAKKGFCSLGSVKANMGHAESAAGIAGVAKVLLQFRHRQLAPTLYCDPPNPDLALRESPFFLQRGLTPWETTPGQPRRAMINSFGAGGVNACVILEEFSAPAPLPVSAQARPRLFVLSARDEDRLRECAMRLSAFLDAQPRTDPDALAYTLQAGREAMPERIAVIADDGPTLARRLGEWLAGKPAAVLRNGGSRGTRNGAPPKMQSTQAKAAWAAGNLGAVAEIWLSGVDIDWDSLYSGERISPIGLPTYAFARERHWIPEGPEVPPAPAASATLHPLLHANTSSLREISFSSRLSPREFYARDHKVNGVGLFPGSCYLELACVAGNIAGEQRVARIQDVVWMHPLGFAGGDATLRTCLKAAGSFIEYRIISAEGGREQVHSEGRLSPRTGDRAQAKAVSIAALRAQCSNHISGKHCHEKFRRIGFDYGPSFRALQEVHAGDSGVLARLKLPDSLKPGFSAYILHPSLLDGAFQAVIGLLDSAEPSAPYLPFAIDELELIRPLPQACHAWVEPVGASKAEGGGLKKFDITLFNDGGEALVKLKGFYVRALAKNPVRQHAEAVA